MTTAVLESRLEAALAFEAPFVIDRLLKNRVAATPAVAEQLFTETKKYLVLCEATPDASLGMFSAMVDEAWHTFILYTAEYTDYGHRYFGRYLHHAPADTEVGGLQEAASFDSFRRRYEEFYREPLPAVWYDESSVAPSSRLLNDEGATLALFVDDQTVHLMDGAGEILLSVNDLAYPALQFIAQTHDFYVRELGGDLTAEEKVGLVTSLIDLGVLRLAP